MSRSYATLDCGIWDEESGFCFLSSGAQRTYFMLVSQRTIAACGTLALTVRRWSRMCADQDIKAWLEELIDHRYIIVDEDTEELLVRTFVKWDSGYKHPQRVKAVIATAKAIQSRSIRTAMAEELAKVGLSSPYQVAPESPRSPNPLTQPTEPETTLPEREPLTPPVDDGPPSPFCSKHPNGTEKPCGPCGTAKMRLARWEKSQTLRKPRPEWCRTCDEATRQVLDPETFQPIARCAVCHPSTAKAAS